MPCIWSEAAGPRATSEATGGSLHSLAFEVTGSSLFPGERVLSAAPSQAACSEETGTVTAPNTLERGHWPSRAVAALRRSRH